MLETTTEIQIARIAAQYGAPRRVTVTLQGWPFDPLDRGDRYGEVCMVIRRPGGTLLTATKTYYPPECFRLMTGGVSHGEQIMDALLREVDEETGLTVEVRRFLAVIEYRLAQEDAPEVSFATFAFLLDEVAGTLAARDPNERLAAYREIMPSELPDLADMLDEAPAGFDPEIGGSWRDWGRFRAVVHRVVYDGMNDEG
jgi:ADP-ribose pyrophosphatase YjhB (NUDIX family)